MRTMLLGMTAKLDSTALSIQRQIENKSRDVKAKEKKRERKAIEAKTFMVQKQFLDMQTAFQEKISEEFAAQRNRSQLEKGLKKLKLLMETTKTANAEQGKRAFELEVKRLELAQEQARADALADRADARADRADARRHSKRQRSRSARFHFALFCFA
jgi:succinate dehydrogenase/fumarate reductase flavoprotein subunit